MKIRFNQAVQSVAALAGTLGLAIASPAASAAEIAQSNLLLADDHTEEVDPTDPMDPLQQPEPMDPMDEMEPADPTEDDLTAPSDPLQEPEPMDPMGEMEPVDPTEGDLTEPADPLQDPAGMDPMEDTDPMDEMDPMEEMDPMNEMEETEPQAVDTSSMNIVEVASSNSSFNTLVQAVQAAELANTLSGEGPFTVFAPTDAAFADLPTGALDLLLLPENQDLLQRVLQYHVVPGEVTSGELSTGKVESLNGGLAVLVTDSSVIINDASVVQPNIQASNGVIHVVSRVLMPRELRNDIVARLGS